MTRIEDHSVSIAYAGLGLAGLYQAYELARCGYEVHAFDPDRSRVQRIQTGEISDPDIDLSALIELQAAGSLDVFCDWEVLPPEVDIVCASVPSALEAGVELSPLSVAGSEMLSRYGSSARLWLNRSTCVPGTTRGLWGAALHPNLAYSAERRELGRRSQTVPVCVAASSQDALDASSALLRCEGPIVELSSIEVGELAKLLENAFRYVNIAYVNALRRTIPEGLLRDAIDAASTKPFGFMAFRPGEGIGGPYIPGAMKQLARWVEEIGSEDRLLSSVLASESEHVKWIASHVVDLATEVGADRIHFNGIAWKNGVTQASTYDTPRLRVIEKLLTEGWHVSYFDAAVESVTVAGMSIRSSNLRPEDADRTLVVVSQSTLPASDSHTHVCLI